MTIYGGHPLVGRAPGRTYYGPGGKGMRGKGDKRQAARMQEADAAYWFALECREADPETFESIRGRSFVNICKPPELNRDFIVTNQPARGREAIQEAMAVPEWAVVRTGPQTANVVHTPSGKVVGHGTIEEAIRIRGTVEAAFARMGRVAA